jgi:hypothetical protein
MDLFSLAIRILEDGIKKESKDPYFKVFMAFRNVDRGVFMKTRRATYFVIKKHNILECTKKDINPIYERNQYPSFDLSDQIDDLVFPIHIQYNTLGFMGPLSGGGGEYIIYGDGHIENHNEMMS